MIEETVEIVRQQAAERNITIHLEAQKIILNADRGKIKRVILNLTTNAIKYNREGGAIYIRAVAVPESGDPPTMGRLSVRDTGRGLSEESQRHMFEKFYRAADTAGTQGTGLGW